MPHRGTETAAAIAATDGARYTRKDRDFVIYLIAQASLR